MALMLAGCFSTPIEYQSKGITQPEADQIIEQVVMEQPPQMRPQAVYINSQYIGFGNGTISQGKSFGSAAEVVPGAVIGGSSSTVTTKEMNERIYFNSIGKVQLYTKRNRYTVQVLGTEGHVIRNFYMTNRVKAERFIDSLNFYRDRAPALGTAYQ